MVEREANSHMKCAAAADWDAHRREIDITGRKVDKTYARLIDMANDVSSTAKVLEKASTVLDTIKEDLVGAATGRKQISIVSHLLTVGILGIIALVILVERSQKVIHFGATALTPELTISNSEQPMSGEHHVPNP